MYISYKKSKVFYKTVGNGNNIILFLHGWGGSIKSFEFVSKNLDDNYKLLFIDFPPFGKSEEPKIPYTIYDYENIVIKLLDKENVKKPIIVGHSFGGRVAILLASHGFAEKIVLVDSAGLKPKRHINYYFKIYKYKLLKKMGIKTNSGSKDYKSLTPICKKTFVNIVNTNLENYAKNIDVPTLIFWGEKDKETPMYMAKKLNKIIKNSELVIIKNAGHFSYLDDYNTFIYTLKYFIK